MADVARSLPKALKRLGHQVTVITPLHSQTDTYRHNLTLIKENIPLNVPGANLTFNIWKGYLMTELPVYFIQEHTTLSRQYSIENKPQELYTGNEIDNQRFFIFDVAVIETIKLLDLTPDVIQCHDWQSGLIPNLLRTRYHDNESLKRIGTLYTIHNLTFQMGPNWWEVQLDMRDNGRDELPNFSETEKINHINFAQRAILNADLINTVSEQYAEEIMTKKFGNELHTILKQRKNKVLGIVNGIDYSEWNPSRDPGLVARYDFDELANKTKNKLYLQKFLNLPEDPKIPIICWTSRLTEQKGIDLIIETIDSLLSLDIQLVILGEGAKQYEEFFTNISKKHPKKIAAILDFDNQKETMVLAGADIFLLPSRFEPCGLAQLKSLRYGAIPIVHAVGGLADTITDFSPKTHKGNGFVFKRYKAEDLLIAVTRALENHKHRDTWLRLVRHAMRQSFSWEIPAKKYVTLLRKTIRNHEDRNH